MENKKRISSEERYHLFACTVTAVMTALSVVLERFLSVNTTVFKIGLAFVPIALVAILFGPLYSLLAGCMTDLVGAILFPTGVFFPGFTVTAALCGFCYGLFLYRAYEKKHLFWRVLIPALINNLIFGLLINTLWISLYFSPKGYWQLFISRLLTQYAFLIPMNLILIPVLIRVCRGLSSRIPERK